MAGTCFVILLPLIIFKVPCFKDAPAGLIEILAQYVKVQYILKGEYIVQEEDMAREVCTYLIPRIIIRGIIEISIFPS